MATGASRVRAVLVCMLCRLIAVHAQSFTVKAIGQLSPLADSANILSVTLVTDTDLSGSEGSAIAISGLSGAVMKSITGGDQTSIPLQGGADLDAFSDGVLKIKKRGAWDPAGVLTLTVSEDRTVTAGTTYAFRINTRNPPYAMASPVVTISASGSATIAPTAMTKPGTPIHGVVRGADPLTVAIPKILSSAIYQSNPLALASNTFTINLNLTVEMTRGSIISIIGLQDTCTPKSGFVQVQALSERGLDLIASWGKTASLELALLVQIGCNGASNQSLHSLTMNVQLQNCNYARRYLPLKIGGYILPPGGQLPQDGSPLNGGLMLEMSTIRQPREGVPDGSLPLLVVVPTMETKIILQSNPFAGQDNTLTVTLASTVNMSPHSHITLQGFRGIRDGSGELSITCSPAGIRPTAVLYSSPKPSKVILQIGPAGLVAHRNYTLSFSVMNALQAQTPPVLSVCGDIEAGDYDSKMECTPMDYTHGCLLGMANAQDPLRIYQASLRSEVEQRSASFDKCARGTFCAPC